MNKWLEVFIGMVIGVNLNVYMMGCILVYRRYVRPLAIARATRKLWRN